MKLASNLLHKRTRINSLLCPTGAAPLLAPTIHPKPLNIWTQLIVWWQFFGVTWQISVNVHWLVLSHAWKLWVFACKFTVSISSNHKCPKNKSTLNSVPVGSLPERCLCALKCCSTKMGDNCVIKNDCCQALWQPGYFRGERNQNLK